MSSLPYDILEPAHPTGRELSEFERRLLRLRLIGHEAHILVCAITRTEDRKTDDDLVLTLQNYSLILICRFLEIWAQFQSLGRDNRRVREIAAAASLLIDRINIWPGLRDYRDWILAHRYQIGRNPEFVPPWCVYSTGRVPTKAAEWILLLECTRLATASVMAYFGDIYRALAPTLKPGEEPAVTQGVTDGAEAQKERVQLARKMNQRLTAVGVSLDDAVFKEFSCQAPQSAG